MSSCTSESTSDYDFSGCSDPDDKTLSIVAESDYEEIPKKDR